MNQTAGKTTDTLSDKQEEPEAVQHIYALLLGLSSRIATARDKQDLVDILTDKILSLFGGKYFALHLMNEEGKTHSPYLFTPENTISSRTDNNPVGHGLYPVDDGIFNMALAAEQPVIFRLNKLIQQKHVPAYIIHWFNAGVQEVMLVKIMKGNVATGVLYVYAVQTGTFSAGQYGLLAGMSSMLGMAISNILANEKIARQLQEIHQYRKQLEHKTQAGEQKTINNFSPVELVGDGPEIKEVFRLVSQVATSDTTVVLMGETGTGKELVARAIHSASLRSDKPMIKVNCAALPATLIESELFGHERGSFTNATDQRIGKFELAHESTLFLDEVGELPLELQAKLLRALQEKEIERVGGNGSIKANARIIAATNRDLAKEVLEGRFRSDLYYRLHVFPIRLPALRNRMGDIRVLAQHFISRFTKATGNKVKGLSAKALNTLMAYHFPGNVRELEHLLERSVLLANGPLIDDIELPKIQSATSTISGRTFEIKPLAEMEKEYILSVVKACNGRIFGKYGAAARLQVPGTTLISKMQKLGISKEHFAVKE